MDLHFNKKKSQFIKKVLVLILIYLEVKMNFKFL